MYGNNLAGMEKTQEYNYPTSIVFKLNTYMSL